MSTLKLYPILYK